VGVHVRDKSDSYPSRHFLAYNYHITLFTKIRLRIGKVYQLKHLSQQNKIGDLHLEKILREIRAHEANKGTIGRGDALRGKLRENSENGRVA